MSPLPGIIALMRGRLPLENKKLHDKYGSVVRVSPNELAFNSVGAWEDIYGHRPGHPNMHKDPIHVGSVEAVQGVTTLTMADDENHARQRRALSHSFSQKALSEQEYIVKRYVDQLIRCMYGMAERDEEFNLVGVPVEKYADSALTRAGQLAELHHLRHHWRLGLWGSIRLSRPREIPRVGVDDLRDCQSRGL